jgi:hypothetical protein
MRLLSMIVLLTCLALAGCANSASSGKDSDGNNRFGGFYGGATGGGGTMP